MMLLDQPGNGIKLYPAGATALMFGLSRAAIAWCGITQYPAVATKTEFARVENTGRVVFINSKDKVTSHAPLPILPARLA